MERRIECRMSEGNVRLVMSGNRGVACHGKLADLVCMDRLPLRFTLVGTDQKPSDGLYLTMTRRRLLGYSPFQVLLDTFDELGGGPVYWWIEFDEKHADPARATEGWERSL